MTLDICPNLRPVWATIDLQALSHNYRQLKKICHPGDIMPVVKADAYGHGVVPTVRALWAEGARFFAVAYLEEALEIREHFPMAQILVMGSSLPEQAAAFLADNIMPAVTSWEQAVAFSQVAREAGKTLGIHIKIDTGMGRLGFLAKRSPEREDSSESVAQLILEISRLPGLRLEGIYTHLADADEGDTSIADEQWQLFQHICNDLRQLHVNVPIQHIANSSGILRWRGRPDRICEYSRPGIVIYGISPLSDTHLPAGFRPVLSLHSKITHLKDLPAGHSVSYNRTYVAASTIRVAVLPLGYADGLRRELSNLGQVLIKGQRVPIIGRVCMDQSMVDVTSIPNVALGDEVVLIGRSGEDEITAGEMAGWCRTIPYEIVCGISKRVTRMYGQ